MAATVLSFEVPADVVADRFLAATGMDVDSGLFPRSGRETDASIVGYHSETGEPVRVSVMNLFRFTMPPGSTDLADAVYITDCCAATATGSMGVTACRKCYGEVADLLGGEVLA